MFQQKGMLPLFDAGYINLDRQYLTIGVNGLVEAAESLGIAINHNPQYKAFVQEVLGIIERYNKKYRSRELMFNCEIDSRGNVGVKQCQLGQGGRLLLYRATATTVIFTGWKIRR